MIRINLLPHRQLKRAERQRQFNIMLAATLALGAVIVFMVNTYISSATEKQGSRNKRLENAIVQLDKEIEEIQKLKEMIRETLERKQAVEDLQGNRSRTVILLDEIARIMPEGIYLRSMTSKGGVITLNGVTDTNARVAALVRNISASQWLESPNLVEIKSSDNKASKSRVSLFTLTFKQKTPKPAEPENPKGAPKSKGKDKQA